MTTPSNFIFDIQGGPLESGLRVAALQHEKVAGWRVDRERNRLVLYWAESAGRSTPFPAPFPTTDMAGFIEPWLGTLDYGRAPDNDGTVEKGCRIYTEQWGHINHEWEAFVAIEPFWKVYGK